MPNLHRPAHPTSPSRPEGAMPRAGQIAPSTMAAARAQWVTVCADRLRSLRPGMDGKTVVAVASELWEELGTHDPGIAAEMEHESRGDETIGAIGASPERAGR